MKFLQVTIISLLVFPATIFSQEFEIYVEEHQVNGNLGDTVHQMNHQDSIKGRVRLSKNIELIKYDIIKWLL